MVVTDFLNGVKKSCPTTWENAITYGNPYGIDCVVISVLLFLYLRIGKSTNPDYGDTTRKRCNPFVVVFQLVFMPPSVLPSEATKTTTHGS